MITSRKWPRRLAQIAAGVITIAVALFGLWAVDTARRSLQAQLDPAGYSLSAAHRLARSSTDGAIETLQSRLRQDPNDQPAYTQLGAAYLQKARETGDPTYYGKAESALLRALELNPDDFLAIAQMGALSLARHDFRQALDRGQKAHAISPETVLIYGVIGDAQVELGEYDAALETFQTMVDLRPDLSSYSRASYMRELYGDVDGAIEAMQRAVQAGGPNAENTNWTRVQLGHLYFNSGRLEEAEAEYKRALAAYPGYVHAEAGLARTQAARREYGVAIQLYGDVVNRMPLPEYVIALGDVYEAAGRSVEARQQFDLVRAIEQLYLSNGVDTDLEMALFAADHGQAIDEALVRARRAFEKRPTIYAADTLAWTLSQAGQHEAAYELAQQALRLGTRDALLLFHAGMIAYRLGRAAEAQSYLEQAVTINPNFSVRYGGQAQDTLAALRRANATANVSNHYP